MARSLLIVDDEEQLVRNIAGFLELTPGEFEVLQAFSGEEALALLATRPVDALLTDVRLPGIDGIEVVRRALKEQPRLKVVVMTAFSSRELRTQAMSEGALRFVEKPLDLEELRTLLVETTEGPSGWSGRVGGLDIIDLAHLIALSGRSTVVRIAYDRESGLLVFGDGELLHASTRTLEGERAFFTMACWEAGVFEEVGGTGEVPPRRNIAVSTAHLLAEAARLRAEGRRGERAGGRSLGLPRLDKGDDGGAFTTTAGHLSGRLEMWSPFDLLQLISQFRKTGRLELFREDGFTGSCSVANGEAIAAQCGHLEGREAMLKFLWWDRGWFAFDADAELPQSVAPIRTAELIMNAVRLADEIERRQAIVPGRNEPIELTDGAQPPREALGSGVGEVFAFLQANPGVTCTQAEERLSLAPVKIRLSLALLAEAGSLRARARDGAASRLPVSAPTPWWRSVIERFPSGLRALVVYAPTDSHDDIVAIAGRLAEALSLPAPSFGLSNEGPSFTRLRPVGGGFLSLTFLPLVRKNRYLFESFVHSVDLVLACNGAHRTLTGKEWASVLPTAVRLLALEHGRPLDLEELVAGSPTLGGAR